MNELKEKILNLCNESGLPLEAIIYVVKDVWRDAEDTLRAVQAQNTQAGEAKEEKE